MRIIKIIFFLLPFCITNSFAQSFDISYYSGFNFEIASFRLWIPKMDNKVKALLVIVPGYNSDGRKAVNDSVWQEFSRKNNLAIIACYFKDYKVPDNFYREASKGSGKALLDAIHSVATDYDLAEIENIPLILYGQSAGGQFNYEFACWKPEKILSFVVNKGGYYHTAIAPVAARKIPAIFFVGDDDLYYRKDIIKGIYSMNRKLGAFWTLIEERNTKHEFKASKFLAIQYFENIIPLRLSPSNELVDISEIEYYLGDWETKITKPAKGVLDSDLLSVWLPNYSFAKIWENQFK